MSPGLAIGRRSFFQSKRMNPVACDQVAFGQIIIDTNGEKSTVNSVPTEDAELAIAIFVK